VKGGRRRSGGKISRAPEIYQLGEWWGDSRKTERKKPGTGRSTWRARRINMQKTARFRFTYIGEGGGGGSCLGTVGDALEAKRGYVASTPGGFRKGWRVGDEAVLEERGRGGTG